MSANKSNYWKDHHERHRPLTLQELEAELENLEDGLEIDAVIIPLEVDELTDEEEIDENLLQAQDVAGTYQIMTADNEVLENSNTENPSTAMCTRKKEKQNSKVTSYIPNWKKKHPNSNETSFGDQIFQEQKIKDLFYEKSPVEVFETF
ncbi:hypothetical protein ILUMI_17209 [Ignelater luminosus]|uniref:Uncharacterized protein n=1 Tax=Ignelater luminosus TaxID=2038154 RepID=A0A8K0CM49_IGNLU|nr:hypothetical protein ILUMI_17209 [Ignelater luminosus]